MRGGREKEKMKDEKDWEKEEGRKKVPREEGK